MIDIFISRTIYFFIWLSFVLASYAFINNHTYRTLNLSWNTLTIRFIHPKESVFTHYCRSVNNFDYLNYIILYSWYNLTRFRYHEKWIIYYLKVLRVLFASVSYLTMEQRRSLHKDLTMLVKKFSIPPELISTSVDICTVISSLDAVSGNKSKYEIKWTPLD